MKGSLFLNKTYSRSQVMGLMESVLFVKGKSTSTDELREIFELSKREIGELVDEMNTIYTERNSGFSIIAVAGGYQIVTNPVFKEELEEIFGKRNENRLSKSVIETLAVIAYKQPISKEGIDKIRGVSSTRNINVLLGYKLINITGATEDIVKSPVYSVTSRFLEMFNIKSMDDLPSIENLNFDDLSFEDEDDIDADEQDENGDELELSL